MQSSQKCIKLGSGISCNREFLSQKAALQLHVVPVERGTHIFSDISQTLYFELSSVTLTTNRATSG